MLRWYYHFLKKRCSARYWLLIEASEFWWKANLTKLTFRQAMTPSARQVSIFIWAKFPLKCCFRVASREMQRNIAILRHVARNQVNYEQTTAIFEVSSDLLSVLDGTASKPSSCRAWSFLATCAAYFT